MKITIKNTPEGYTVKTPDKVAKQLTYGEMLAVVTALTAPADGVREYEYLKPRKKKEQAKFNTFDFAENVAEVNEQALGPLSRRLTCEELIAKGYLIRPPSFSPVFNKHGYDLRFFLPDGWDGVDSEFDFIAIDSDGDIFAYTSKPLCFEEGYFAAGHEPLIHTQLSAATIPSNINWRNLIWERPKTTQP